MTMTDFKDYVKFHHERARKEHNDLKKRRQDAYHEALKCAKILSSAGAKHVYLFGSLNRHDEFQKWSDIDIAVEGLPLQANFFELLITLKEMSDFSINLVKIEKVPYSVQKRIKEGKILL